MMSDNTLSTQPTPVRDFCSMLLPRFLANIFHVFTLDPSKEYNENSVTESPDLVRDFLRSHIDQFLRVIGQNEKSASDERCLIISAETVESLLLKIHSEFQKFPDMKMLSNRSKIIKTIVTVDDLMSLFFSYVEDGSLMQDFIVKLESKCSDGFNALKAIFRSHKSNLQFDIEQFQTMKDFGFFQNNITYDEHSRNLLKDQVRVVLIAVFKKILLLVSDEDEFVGMSQRWIKSARTDLTNSNNPVDSIESMVNLIVDLMVRLNFDQFTLVELVQNIRIVLFFVRSR